MDRKWMLLNLIVTLALAVGVARVAARAGAESAAPPLGAAFTYQGRLMNGQAPANGSLGMTFRLYAASAGGQALGSQTSAVTVTNGLFTALLDFGAGAFDGGARWLEIEIGGTVLAPRQQLTAAPYAVYAGAAPWDGLRGVPADLADGDDVGLSSVRWTDVLSRPAGLDDGDDDTRYAAGAGLALNGAQFSVDTAAIQARVAGACGPGGAIRAVGAGGTAACAPVEPRPGFTSTHIDDPAGIDRGGLDSSATIGADGLMVIAYRRENSAGTFSTLWAAHCADLACSSARLSEIDASGAVGDAISIAIGSDGLPIISYYDSINQDLKVARCADIECAASSVSTLESGRQSGNHSSIAVGGNGLPLVSYYDQTDTSLKLARCGDLACTSAVTATLHDLNDTGKHTSLAIGADGLPLVSFYNQTDGALWAAHCNDAACSSVTATQLDAANDTGLFSALAIGADGLPLIAYYDASVFDLRLARCANLACSSAALVTVDSSATTGFSPSLAVTPDGLPVIAYYSSGLQDLRLARCQSPDCATSTKLSVDSVGATGQHPSLTIGSDGLPIISYYYTFGRLLKVIHCGAAHCAPFARAR